MHPFTLQSIGSLLLAMPLDHGDRIKGRSAQFVRVLGSSRARALPHEVRVAVTPVAALRQHFGEGWMVRENACWLVCRR